MGAKPETHYDLLLDIVFTALARAHRPSCAAARRRLRRRSHLARLPVLAAAGAAFTTFDVAGNGNIAGTYWQNPNAYGFIREPRPSPS
jgi:hypothetical protein